MDDQHTWNVDKIERVVADRIAAERRTMASHAAARPSNGLGSWGGLVAAACAVGMAVMLIWPYHASTPFREFATTTGSRGTVTLRDGTRVVLGPDTHLRVPADFGRGPRTVELDGEAFFAVMHDTRHPFAVHARGTTVRDVGTEFDVRGYGDDRGVRIVVAQGAVTVQPLATHQDAQSLWAGDEADVTARGVAITHYADVAALTGWVQGHLVFEDTPLRDVVRDLDRTFNLTITIADSTLAGHQVSGSFDNESADQVLDAVTAVIGAQYDRAGRSIVIRRRAVGAERDRRSPPHPGLVTVQASEGHQE